MREATAAQIYDAAEGADAVLAETPTNPGLDVVDLHRLAGICRRGGARLLVDNTTATPLGQQPLSLGADLVVASATKALSGHSDLLAGYVAGSHPELMAALERERLLTGAILGSFEAWLVLRSIGSVGLRFARQCQNALALATALRSHPEVRSVRYPGLPEDPSYPAATAQMRKFGGLVGIELADAAAVHDSGAAQRTAGGLDELRWPAHLGGPPGPVGRRGTGRLRPDLGRHRGHRRPGGRRPGRS